jgi:copper chaperone CopZ
MDRITMNIDGMSCGHCVRAVTRALESVNGVEVEQVDLGTATVRYYSQATSPARIAEAVEDEGYRVVAGAK